MKRIHILFSLTAILWPVAATGQIVATGEKPLYENEFRSPMVLETPFVLADPARWNDTWSSEKEYADLIKYCCEKVFIESLKMRAHRIGGNAVAVTIKTKLRNPNGNHDKRVFLTVELQNDGNTVSTVTLPKTQAAARADKGISVEESDAATKTTVLSVLADDLKPTTKLKITMALRND
jgi:hypothetical protein